MILIVDDYPDGAEALCRLLKMEGYSCTTASGGMEAIAAIRSHPQEMPLLVLLDEMMPDITGTDVLKQLRADPSTVHVSVVMFSAGLNTSKREEAMALGALNWMLKGLDVQMTLKTIIDHYHHIGGVKNGVPGDTATASNQANRQQQGG